MKMGGMRWLSNGEPKTAIYFVDCRIGRSRNIISGPMPGCYLLHGCKAPRRQGHALISRRGAMNSTRPLSRAGCPSFQQEVPAWRGVVNLPSSHINTHDFQTLSGTRNEETTQQMHQDPLVLSKTNCNHGLIYLACDGHSTTPTRVPLHVSFGTTFSPAICMGAFRILRTEFICTK